MKDIKEKTSNNKEYEEEDGQESKTILGIFTREQFIMLCVGIGLILLLIIIIIPSVVLTTRSGTDPLRCRLCG